MLLARLRECSDYKFAFLSAALSTSALVGCASDPADAGSGLPTTMQPTAGTHLAASGGAGAAAISAGSAATAAGAGGARAGVTAGLGGLAGAGGSVTIGAAGAGAAGSSAAGAGGSAGLPAAGASGASGSAGLPAAGAGGAAGAAGDAAGSGGTAGSGGAAAGSSGASGAAGAAGAAAHEDLGKGDGSDVVMLGDSWMSNTLQIEGTGGGIAPFLQNVSGQRYANYGLQGVMLLMDDSFGPAIPTQWDDAKRTHDKVLTVVMTGGGNDIIQNASLQSSCQMGGDECKQVLIKISDALDALWTQMADYGVQDIVYIQYTNNTGTLDDSLQGDKGLPTPKICLSGHVRCHSVPTTDIVAKTDLAIDGIHPLSAANTRIAKRVFDLMTSEGMRR